MFFNRLVCCNTDENVYDSSDDSSSGHELGRGGRSPASAAVIHWGQQGPPGTAAGGLGPGDAHSDFLSYSAGSIRVLPSSPNKVFLSQQPQRGPFRKGQSIAEFPSKMNEPEGRGSEMGWAASLVSCC